MHYIQSEQNAAVTHGQDGRPSDYPIISPYPELLFYIQRNQNFNTIIYEANLLQDNLIHLDQPIIISWVYFEGKDKQRIQELNLIQKKLAYGYRHKVISNELVEFRFVSYDDMTFYLAKNAKGQFRVYTKFKGEYIEIDHIYVYTDDFGVFPQVKFIEFFGTNNDKPHYSKLILD